MPRRARKRKEPQYRKHRSGLARVTLNGQDKYLGRFGTPESRAAYYRTMAEWEANRRQPLQGQAPKAGLTVAELILAYKEYCETYYRRTDGTATGECENIRLALRHLRELYEHLPASEFKPLNLKAIREKLMRPPKGRPMARTTINKTINRIRAVFGWAAENELVPGETWYALRAVKPLKRGRSEARETTPIQSVDARYVETILPYLSPQIAAMIRLQLLTGARPGEICLMRTMDIDRSGTVWVYRPRHHKTEHHGIDREILIGGRAQDVLAPFLKFDPEAHVFSPSDVDAWRRRRISDARKTPQSCGNRPGTNRAKRPKIQPGDRYGVHAYARAIQRACDLAYPPPAELARLKVPGGKAMRWETIGEWRGRIGEKNWEELKAYWRVTRFSPNRLRHTAAERIENEFDVTTAQIILGHQDIKSTRHYTRGNKQKARQAMEKIG